MEKLSSTNSVPDAKIAGDAALDDSRGGEPMEGGGKLETDGRRGTWKPMEGGGNPKGIEGEDGEAAENEGEPG